MIERPTQEVVDLLVVGGGVQGAGVARDAAGRGMSVVLCEQHDLAAGTSSVSSKLVHGGLRYLEQRALDLVRESLAERETLLRTAPHIVRPLRFVLPHAPWLRSALTIRLGLFLYDRLGGARTLPASEALRLRSHPLGRGLRPDFKRGFAYSDCQVDDARLVVLCALDAARRGARVLTRTTVVSAGRGPVAWEVTLQPAGGEPRTLLARALVVTAGPWAGRVLKDVLHEPGKAPLRLVQGSHIVVHRLHDGEHALILQTEDRRVVFVLPFEQHYSLIGTTETPLDDPDQAAPRDAEIDYLCRTVGRFLATTPRPADVVWSFCGTRPLFDDGRSDPSRVTREDVIDVREEQGLPLVTVYGGKLTTHRRIAERVLEKLTHRFPRIGPPWTAGSALPGGDVPEGDLRKLHRVLGNEYPKLRAGTLATLMRRHGTLTREVLGDAVRPQDLGQDFGAGLCEREVEYLVRREWVRTADDLLWRRTKLGLALDQGQRAAVAACVERCVSELLPAADDPGSR